MSVTSPPSQISAPCPADTCVTENSRIDQRSRTAIQALIRWGRNPSDEGRRFTESQRSELIDLAEALASPFQGDGDKIERAKLGRVQALYIASMLGCFDALASQSPFKNKLLTDAYIEQKLRLSRP